MTRRVIAAAAFLAAVVAACTVASVTHAAVPVTQRQAFDRVSYPQRDPYVWRELGGVSASGIGEAQSPLGLLICDTWARWRLVVCFDGPRRVWVGIFDPHGRLIAEKGDRRLLHKPSSKTAA